MADLKGRELRNSYDDVLTKGTNGTIEDGDGNEYTLAAIISDDVDTGVVSNSHLRIILSSVDSRSSSGLSSVISSTLSESSGLRSTVAASSDSEASGARSTVVASSDSDSGGSRSVVVSSDGVINNIARSLAMGDGSGTSTANRNIHLFGADGDIDISGSLTQGASFSDFAEMFENATGEEIPVGYILTLDGGKVRPADEEEICGVVSHTGAILAGDTPFCWQGRYETDEWGRRIYEEVPDEDWEPKEGETEKDRPLVKRLKENPDWNPELEQIKRSERPDEWTPVGLLGQVYVRMGEDLQSGDSVKAVKGLGFKSNEKTGLKVMKVTKEFDGDYGIAKCLINVSV